MTYPVQYSQSKDAGSTATVVASSAPIKETQMTIDSEGAAHIMAVLTDLYSDPITAVIREYSSNGVDAQVEAGITTPIEITGPDMFNPTFVVKDRGVGMSTQDIETIYSSYGKSTKRDNFTQTGKFGLGCKSALTFAQQFTVVSVKDGISTTAVISRSDSGVSTLSTTAVVPTTDPNGTTVTIPVKDVDEFSKRLENFNFSGYPSNTVSVNGVVVQSFMEFEGYTPFLDGNAYLKNTSERYWNRSTVNAVMGGVVYEVPRDEVEVPRSLAYTSMYLVLPNDSVDLTPSREGLRFTKRTTSLLNSLISALLMDASSAYVEARDAATSISDLLRVMANIKNSGASMDFISPEDTKSSVFTWNGFKIPKDMRCRVTASDTLRMFEVTRRSTSKCPYSSIYLSPTGGTAVYYLDTSGFSDEDINKYKLNFRKYLLHSGELSSRSDEVLLVMSSIGFDDYHFIGLDWHVEAPSLAEVSASAQEYNKTQKSTLQGTQRARTSGSTKYKVETFTREKDNSYSVEEFELSAKEIPTSDVYYHVVTPAERVSLHKRINEMVALKITTAPTFSVVSLSPSRKTSTLHKRAGFTIPPFSEYIEASVVNRLDTIHENWREIFLRQRNSGTYFSATMANSLLSSSIAILDPIVVSTCTTIVKLSEALRLIDAIDRFLSLMPLSTTRYKVSSSDNIIKVVDSGLRHIKSNYPLFKFNMHYSISMNEVKYLNAMYLTYVSEDATLETPRKDEK